MRYMSSIESVGTYLFKTWKDEGKKNGGKLKIDVDPKSALQVPFLLKEAMSFLHHIKIVKLRYCISEDSFLILIGVKICMLP